MSASTAAEPSYLAYQKGIKSWLYTLDHKRIGLLYLWSILAFFIVGGIAAMLVRTELYTAGRTIMDADTYNRLFTLHGAAMVFLFIVPGIPATLGNFLLPLMIGARDVAFPRLNMWSYYVYMFGALFTLLAMINPVDTGWTFYTPYSLQSNTMVIAMTFGVFVMGFSSIMTGLNFIVTIHKLRAPGMTWGRLPLFAWSSYATAVIQVLATPIIGITLLLLIAERVLDVGIFDPAKGGDPVLFQHFFWFYSHPVVYIMILPAMGVISEVIPVFSRKPIFGYKAIAGSSLAIALISFIVWGHHLFVSGMSSIVAKIFSFLTFLVAIPTAIKVFNWVATMYKGRIEMRTPLLYALGFLFLFTIGGLTGIFLATLPIDVHMHDTYFVVAHFHFVMVGGTVFGMLAGLHMWWPKMFGHMYSEFWAKVAFWFTLAGFSVTFLPQFVLGTRGMPRRYYDYLPEFEGLHQLSTYGAWLIAVGLLIVFINLGRAIRNGPEAGNNPFRSKSLEWWTTSPPPHENFDEIPTVEDWTYGYGQAADKKA